jgi:ApaG protein
MYTTKTRNIEISVQPKYLGAESSPEKNHYVWAYKVLIENHGQETIQVKSRYWKITDAYGRVNEVRGDGVVGEQPILKPGERFEYTSGTPLPTSSGFMVGHYSVCTDGGMYFDIDIPLFSLDIPFDHTRKLN